MGADTTNNEAYSTTMQASPQSKPRIVLTVTRLTWLERCTRRLWLDVHGDPGARVDETPAAQLRAADGQHHEHTTIEATHGPAKQFIVHNWPERVQKTLDLMHQGVSGIRQAGLEVEIMPGVRLCGQVDALVRVEAPSSLGTWSYEPVEIKQHEEPTRWDRLQLDLYRAILGRLLGAIPAGELWLGTTDTATPARRVRVGAAVDMPESLWQQLVNLLSAAEPPPIWFDRKHCSYCPWQYDCEQTAVAQGDLAILPNLHPTTARELREDDIISVQQIAAMHPRNLQLYSNVGQHGPRLHAAATALSLRKLVRLPHNQPSQAIDVGPMAYQTPIFLDIETHGYDPWGFGLATSDKDLRIVLVASDCERRDRQSFMVDGVRVDLVPTAQAGWQEVTEAARQASGPLIHWSKHEPKCLERTADPLIRQELAGRLLDAHKVMSESMVLPIPRLASGPAAGVKAISRYLGIDREDVPDDWSLAEAAYLYWYQSFRQGAGLPDTTLLVPVVRYLRADVLGLSRIWLWFNEQLGKQ